VYLHALVICTNYTFIFTFQTSFYLLLPFFWCRIHLVTINTQLLTFNNFTCERNFKHRLSAYAMLLYNSMSESYITITCTHLIFWQHQNVQHEMAMTNMHKASKHWQFHWYIVWINASTLYFFDNIVLFLVINRILYVNFTSTVKQVHIKHLYYLNSMGTFFKDWNAFYTTWYTCTEVPGLKYIEILYKTKCTAWYCS